MNVWEFITERGRPPLLDRGERPWSVQGWLLYYVQQAHVSYGLCGNRWGYHLGAAAAGELPPDPIPRIEFGPYDPGGTKHLWDCARLVGATGWWHEYRRLIDWLAFGLLVGKDDCGLGEDVQEQLYRKFDALRLLAKPYDYFGHWICEGRGKGWNPNGFYPTPHGVCECMVRMQMHDAAARGDRRRLTVCDPCVGTGRMLLHASNYSLRLHGQDNDGLVLKCCLINMALFAPWGAFPLRDAVFAGGERRSVSVTEDRTGRRRAVGGGLFVEPGGQLTLF